MAGVTGSNQAEYIQGVAQKHGFQYEKAVKRWCGPDAMVKRRKEATWAE
jgi:hypothetical protein